GGTAIGSFSTCCRFLGLYTVSPGPSFTSNSSGERRNGASSSRASDSWLRESGLPGESDRRGTDCHRQRRQFLVVYRPTSFSKWRLAFTFSPPIPSAGSSSR